MQVDAYREALQKKIEEIEEQEAEEDQGYEITITHCPAMGKVYTVPGNDAPLPIIDTRLDAEGWVPVLKRG